MHCDDGFPALTCKAYNGRLFLVYLTTCLSSLSQSTNDVEVRLALAACRGLCVFFDRIERAGRYLTREQSLEIYSATRMFVLSYDRLARLCVSRGAQRFKLIPKIHTVVHLAENMLYHRYNCKYHHCFKDEDMVGVMKQLAAAVHKGPLMEFRILSRFGLRLSAWNPGTGMWSKQTGFQTIPI